MPFRQGKITVKLFKRIAVSLLTGLLLKVGLGCAQNVANETFKKGIEYAVQGRFEDAKEKFKEALKTDPTLGSAKDSLKVIEDLTDKKTESEAAIYFFKVSLGDFH